MMDASMFTLQFKSLYILILNIFLQRVHLASLELRALKIVKYLMHKSAENRDPNVTFTGGHNFGQMILQHWPTKHFSRRKFFPLFRVHQTFQEQAVLQFFLLWHKNFGVDSFESCLSSFAFTSSWWMLHSCFHCALLIKVMYYCDN